MYLTDRVFAAKPAAEPVSKTLVLTTMCLGVLMAQIDTSVVNLAIKEIDADLNAGVSAMQWVVDSYNLVYASLLLTGGTLGDLYGRRRIFLYGVGLFLGGSLLCGLAPEILSLIAGRSLTGLGAALLLPCSLSILTVTYPDKQERAHAIGVWASCNGLAYAIGPTLGGVLVDVWGWRSTFLVAVPVSLATIVLALRAVAESADPRGRHLDLPGQFWTIIGLAALALAVIEGPNLGWSSHTVIGAFAVSAISIAMFLMIEGRKDGGLVPLDLFANAPFSAALTCAACMTFGMYGLLFLTPLYLQSVLGSSAVMAGLELLPMSLTFVLVSTCSGRLSNAVGPRLVMTVGMACMGLGEAGVALLAGGGDLLLIEIALLVVGVGLGLNTGPVNAVAVAHVPAARSGTASGLVNTTRMVGATLGIAVLGTIYGAHAGASVASGVQAALLAGGAIELVGAAVALVFIGRKPSSGGDADRKPSKLMQALATRRARSRERAQLLDMSERELRDIGISRVDVQRMGRS